MRDFDRRAGRHPKAFGNDLMASWSGLFGSPPSNLSLAYQLDLACWRGGVLDGPDTDDASRHAWSHVTFCGKISDSLRAAIDLPEEDPETEEVKKKKAKRNLSKGCMGNCIQLLVNIYRND